MGKKLIAYFSASGVTARIARRLQEAVGGDLYEIRPAVPYTSADLDWRSNESRSSVEMRDPLCRPAMADTDAPVAEADTVYIGFPVWWYREPSIIDSFLTAYDFSGKTVIPFATSGASEIGAEAPKRMQEEAPQAKVLEGRRFSADASADELKAWADSLSL